MPNLTHEERRLLAHLAEIRKLRSEGWCSRVDLLHGSKPFGLETFRSLDQKQLVESQHGVVRLSEKGIVEAAKLTPE